MSTWEERSANARQMIAEAEEASKHAVHLHGGRRCAIKQSEWIDGWWVGTSPRNGDDALVEGGWEDWLTLARSILDYDAKIRAGEASVSIPKSQG